MCAVSPLFHAFAKAGTKPVPYPEKPYELVVKDASDPERTSEQKTKQTKKAMQVSQAVATMWNEALNKQKKGGSDAGSRIVKTENNVGQSAGIDQHPSALLGPDGAQRER